MPNRTTIVVRDLVLPFFIGILDREKRAKQNVSINIDMQVDIPDRPSEAREDFVDYGVIVEYLTGLSENNRHIALVEELADDICDVLFADRRILEVRVEILKPEIFEQAGGVGVVMERRNPSLTP